MSARTITFLTTSALVFALALAMTGTSLAMPTDVGGPAPSEPQLVVSPTTVDNSFDWQTAGLGAGAFLLALCAVTLGAMTLGSRERRAAH